MLVFWGCQIAPLHPVLYGVGFKTRDGGHLAENQPPGEEHRLKPIPDQCHFPSGCGDDRARDCPFHCIASFLCGTLIVAYGRLTVKRNHLTIYRVYKIFTIIKNPIYYIMYVLTNAVRHCRMLNQYRQIAAKQCRGAPTTARVILKLYTNARSPSPSPAPSTKSSKTFPKKLPLPYLRTDKSVVEYIQHNG